MVDVYRYVDGDGPLLVSMPHDGTVIPEAIADSMTEQGRAVPDTDWHVRRLYDFLDGTETHLLCANYSRFVIDLNRPADGTALYPGRDETSLCPVSSFDREAIYKPGAEPDQDAIQLRIQRYWRPYHQQLQAILERIRDRYGYALLWDAHSIRSRVPRFFNGRLPDFNLGTANGLTCPDSVLDKLHSVVVNDGKFSVVSNARFKGGFITRHYASAAEKIFTVQLELAQSTYMDEAATHAYRPQLAARVRPLIEEMLKRFQAEVLAS